MSQEKKAQQRRFTFQSAANRTSSPSVPISIYPHPACEQNVKRLFEYNIEPRVGLRAIYLGGLGHQIRHDFRVQHVEQHVFRRHLSSMSLGDFDSE